LTCTVDEIELTYLQGAAKKRPPTKTARNGLIFQYEIFHEYL